MSKKVLLVTLTTGQSSPEGRVVGGLLYGPISHILKRDEYSGYPHNGGEHTLSVKLTPEDFKAFVDIVVEHFSQKGDPWKTRAVAFHDHCLSQFAVAMQRSQR